MASTQQPDRIIIGVDFGTTFSGVAEAFSGTPISADELNVIKTWPGGNNVTSDKVPSEIAYIESESTAAAEDWTFIGDAFDTSSLQASLAASTATTSPGLSVRWGFQLRPDEPRLRCIKLFLDPRQDLPAYVSRGEIQQLLSDSGKDAVEVVADYLRKLYEHTQEELIKKYGGLFMRTTEIQWILTVPAIWSDAAKDATRSAARAAGMGPELTLISEPEAAAVYTLQAIQPNYLNVGDNFVVCDAGGGTVDLISYEIRQTRPLRIEESAEGSGACCGAAMLNAKFEEMIRQKMGEDKFARLRRDKSRTWLTALRYFEEYVKRNFDPTNPTDFNIPMPGVQDDASSGIEQGFLTLSFQEIARMFGPIITDIINLVEGQISTVRARGKTVAGIVLVGGFGQSSCLYKALKLKYTGQPEGRNADSPLEVLQPSNAWTAVVRGAVLRGVEGVDMVLSRKSRRHYGVLCRKPFNPAIHPLSCRVWDEYQGVWMANNQVTWFIKKDQTISSSTPILSPFCRDFDIDRMGTQMSTLVVCDRNNAPSYHRASTRSPTSILCRLPVNFDNVPAHLFETHQGSEGNFYHHLGYDLGMQVESGGLRFDLRIDGVSYGDVTAEFDSE